VLWQFGMMRQSRSAEVGVANTTLGAPWNVQDIHNTRFI
jgi:hypothetical protein